MSLFHLITSFSYYLTPDYLVLSIYDPNPTWGKCLVSRRLSYPRKRYRWIRGVRIFCGWVWRFTPQWSYYQIQAIGSPWMSFLVPRWTPGVTRYIRFDEQAWGGFEFIPVSPIFPYLMPLSPVQTQCAPIIYTAPPLHAPPLHTVTLTLAASNHAP